MFVLFNCLFVYLFTESLPKLLALNKVDILLAVKRFGNRRKPEALDNEDEGSSEQERKRNRAKKAGIMVPLFGEAFAGQNGVPALELARKSAKAGGGKAHKDRLSTASNGGGPGSSSEPEKRVSQYSSGGEELLAVPSSPGLPRSPARDKENHTPRSPGSPRLPARDRENHTPRHGRFLVGGIKLLPDLYPPPDLHVQGVRPGQEHQKSEAGTQVTEGSSWELQNHSKSSGAGMSPSRRSVDSTPEHGRVSDSPKRGRRPVLQYIQPSPRHQHSTPSSPRLTSEKLYPNLEHEVTLVPSSPSNSPRGHTAINGSPELTNSPRRRAAIKGSPVHTNSPQRHVPINGSPLFVSSPRGHAATNGLFVFPSGYTANNGHTHTPQSTPKRQNGMHHSEVECARVPFSTQEPERNGYVRNGNLSAVNSSSLPNLLEDDPPSGHAPAPTSHHVSPRHGQMSQSTDNLLEDRSERGGYSSANGVSGAGGVANGKRWSDASNCGSPSRSKIPPPVVCPNVTAIQT